MGNQKSTNLLNSNIRSSGTHDIPHWLTNVLEYCDFNDRAKLPQINKSCHRHCKTSQFYFFLCQRLAEERGLYVPEKLPVGETWQSLFYHLCRLKNLWFPVASENEDMMVPSKLKDNRWRIQVFARFRPLREGQDLDTVDEEQCSKVTLPLHQRLAMIKMSRKIKSNKEALKVLAQEGSWFQEKWRSVNERENEDKENRHKSNVGTAKSFYTTALRGEVKFDHKKIVEGSKIVSKVLSCDGGSGRVVMLTADVGIREFSFDGVLPSNATQQSTYDTCVKKLVVDMLNGFNATAVVYGQTGSGKTFSMFGPHADDSPDRDLKKIFQSSYAQEQLRGIVPRACEEILRAIERRRHISSTLGIDSELRISYVEIYGDYVSDLLKNGQRCGQNKVASQRYVLSGAAEESVQSLEDLQALLERGDAQKRRAATAMNDRSTRAHSLFILSLRQRKRSSVPGEAPVTVTSRLFLADLGGSEQVKKSQVEAGEHRKAGEEQQFSVGFELGEHMREAVYINLGLLALKKCVEALQTNSKHVPFHDSKLTMLLSDGLGGNCKTTIIVCGNLEPRHAHETVATLRFGERCAQLQTSTRNNASMLEDVLDDLDRRIAALEEEILRKEHWEMQETRRDDALAEEGTLEKALGGMEVIKVAVVTGAEQERKQLERLLLQRTALLGHDVVEEEQGRKVIGFGKKYAEVYGLGQGYDEALEDRVENTRFAQKAAVDSLPAVLQKRGLKKSAWATEGTAVEEKPEVVTKKAAKANRSKLAYSGISA